MLDKQVRDTKTLTIRQIVGQAHACGRRTRRKCWRLFFMAEHGLTWREYRELEKEVLYGQDN